MATGSRQVCSAPLIAGRKQANESACYGEEDFSMGKCKKHDDAPF